MINWKDEEILVLAKAYPTPSTKHGETVCTAGITRSGEWIRLYPIAFRDLPFNKRYEKFQWIKAKIAPAKEKLSRPESYKVDLDSIKLLEKIPSGRGWNERNKYIQPLLNKSLEEIIDMQGKKNKSLGIFKPEKVIEFRIERVESDWDQKQKAKLGQEHMFGKKKTLLEKIPYSFHYKFNCNSVSCKTHDLTIVDWDINQTYRHFKETYKTEELIKEKLKEKWFNYFFNQRESYFVVGTDSKFGKFMILTVISPKRKDPQLSLFN